MRKRNRKIVSLLVSMAFLISLLVPMVGPAAADTTYGDYSGAYKYVVADTNQSAGYLQVTEKTATKWDGIDVYAKVTLPAGVKFKTKPTAASTLTDYAVISGGTGTITFADSASNMLQVKVASAGAAADVVKFKFDTADKSTLDIDASVTGDVNATIEIMGVSAGAIQWVESDTKTIAKVSSKKVTITAGDSKTVEVGNTKTGADVTIQESLPGALAVDEAVYVQIETTDVTFNAAPTATPSFVTVGAVTPSADNKLAWFTITAQSSALSGKVVITPVFNVPPSVTGDIQLTIYSNTSGTKVEKTTVTVATVGTTTASLKDLKDNTGKVYAGQTKALDASFKLEAASGSKMKGGKIIQLDLNAGKFNSAPTLDGSAMSLFNDSKSAWLTLVADDDSIEVKNFNIKAAGDQAEGNIEVTISGSAGASGTAVIGTFAKPFTVTADKPVMEMLKNGQAAGDIIITEAGAGSMKYKIFVKLPDGVSFDGTPTVKKTSGNIVLGSAAVGSDGILEIPVTTKSGIASTIKVSGIKYNVGRLAVEGDLSAKIYGDKTAWNDDKTLATVSNATVVSTNYANASFVIGSTSYTVNGVEKTVDVAPYIKNDRTFLPVRYVANALGVSDENIMWNAADQSVVLIKGDRVVKLTIGSNIMMINGISFTMDVAPEIVAPGRTMLPLRWVAQALGASVGWDDATQTVNISLK